MKESRLDHTEILSIKADEAAKVDYLLNELYESGKSKQEIIEQVSKFCIENKLRRDKILDIQRKILAKRKKLKAHHDDVESLNTPLNNQKNLIYFIQCIDKIKHDVEERSNCEQNIFNK